MLLLVIDCSLEGTPSYLPERWHAGCWCESCLRFSPSQRTDALLTLRKLAGSVGNNSRQAHREMLVRA